MDTSKTLQGICCLLEKALINKISIWIQKELFKGFVGCWGWLSPMISLYGYISNPSRDLLVVGEGFQQ